MVGGRQSTESSNIRDFICNAGAGGAAGAMAATFVCPLDVIKTRLQVHGLPPNHKGSIIITTLRDIMKIDGWKGMYRGLSPTILALLPNWAVYFPVYEKFKGMLHSVDDADKQLGTGSHMIAAAGAGAATAITTNPLWVVKTRLQTQSMRPDVVPYKGVFSALTRIMHEEGFRGLYSGILPSLVGVSHVAIQFPAYESMKQYMAKKGNTRVEELSSVDVAIASSISKVAASLITYPHEVIRSRLQEQGQARNSEIKYKGVFDCIKKVFYKEGIPGFYRGCATNLLRTTPSAVITFTSYEMIRQFLHRIVPPHPNNNSSTTGTGRRNGEDPDYGATQTQTQPEEEEEEEEEDVSHTQQHQLVVPLSSSVRG